VQLEEKQNEELLELSRRILTLTDAVHRLALARGGQEAGAAAPLAGDEATDRPTHDAAGAGDEATGR
jgi:hypothetical protein